MHFELGIRCDLHHFTVEIRDYLIDQLVLAVVPKVVSNCIQLLSSLKRLLALLRLFLSLVESLVLTPKILVFAGILH